MSMPSPYDCWVLSRLSLGDPVSSEQRTGLTDDYRPLAELLAINPPEASPQYMQGFFAGRKGGGEALRAIAMTTPGSPEPAREAVRVSSRSATLASVRRLMSDTSWPWPGWLCGGVLNVLAADPGIGKTILAANLARILWQKLPWPDGQANPFPEQTRTLWVPGDQHFAQLADLAARYGVPDDAMIFNAPDDEPMSGLDLDAPESIAALKARVKAESPGLVIVDTVGMTTSRNLCRVEDAREYFTPLLNIATETRTAFLLLTHLSKDAQALGRRIVGVARVVWKLTQPDPENQPNRRRFWVDKSYMLKPDALGISIAEFGCTFDNSPPAESRTSVGETPKVSTRLEKTKQWLSNRLANGPVPTADLVKESKEQGYSIDYLYKARNEVGVEESGTWGSKSWSLSEE